MRTRMGRFQREWTSMVGIAGATAAGGGDGVAAASPSFPTFNPSDAMRPAEGTSIAEIA